MSAVRCDTLVHGSEGMIGCMSSSDRVQNSELTVYIAKQNLKRKAVDGDQPTKYLTSEAVSGTGLKARAKLGYQLSAHNRMLQRSRRAIAYVPETISRYRGSLTTFLIKCMSQNCLLLTIKYQNQLKSKICFGQKSLSDKCRCRTNVANFRYPMSDKCRCRTNVAVGQMSCYLNMTSTLS